MNGIPRKGTEFPWIAKRAAKFIDQLGHNGVTHRSDNEPAIEALTREIAEARQEGSQTVPEKSQVENGNPTGSSSAQWDPVTHGGSSGSGAQTSVNSDTDTGDVTKEGRTGPAHG